MTKYNLDDNSLKPGDRFDKSGYDEVANIQTDQGSVMLLHNNSSHYLIAEEDHYLDIDGGRWVRLRSSHPYNPLPEGRATTWHVYVECLVLLCHYARAGNQSLKEN